MLLKSIFIFQQSSNTESAHHTDKADSKKDQPQQDKPPLEAISKTANSGLTSLGNLPPLTGLSFPMKQSAATLPAINKQKDMHQIKAMIDLGLGKL